MLGGTLLVTPLLTLPVLLGPLGGGAQTLQLTEPALRGANLDFQAIVLDPCFSSGLAMSAGLEVWIG